MPSPTSALSTQRPDLASFMEFDLAMDRMGFIGSRVMPTINVAKQSGNFGKIAIEDLLQASPYTNRAPGAKYERGDWTFTPSTYACEEHGWEEPVDDNEATMYAEYFDAEQIAAQRAYDAVLRNQEARIEAAIFNTTTWTGASLTTAVTNEWDDAANATPIADVLAATKLVYDNSGLWPNALIVNRRVFKNLKAVDEIQAVLASSGAGVSYSAGRVTQQQLAEVFDLEYILVGGATENTADEGQAASLSPVWSNEYAMVCRIATTNDMREPCIGRTFHWSEDGSQIGGRIESYRDETVRSEIIRVRHQVDEVVLYAQMGHLLSNITT